MLRDVSNISNTFAKEGFDPSIFNHVRDVNRVPHIHSQNEAPPSNKQPTRIANLRSLTGKAQEPLTNHLVRLEII